MSSSTPLNSHPQDAVAGHNAKSGVGTVLPATGGQHSEQVLIAHGYVPVRQLTGKVVGVWGDAHIRHLDGTITELHVGDVIKKGEVVLTGQDGIVQLEASHSTQFATAASSEVERVISQVGQGDIDVAPAAGPNSGGAAGSLEEGLRVGRDAEAVTPAALAFNPAGAPTAAPQAQAVSPLGGPPGAHPDTESTDSNTPIVFDPRLNDTSTTPITIVAVAGHPIDAHTPVTLPQGTVTMNPDGTLTFTPNHDVSGSISFTYTESNGSPSTSTSTSTVTVNVVSQPGHVPVAVNDTFSGHENTVITGNVSANDTPSLDGGNHWTLATGAAHGTVTLNADGSFSYAPAANYSGPDSFTYTVTDVDGSASTATVTLAVTPVPLAADDTIAAKQNTTATGSLATNDTPAAGEINTWAVASLPAHGQVTVNADGTFTYVPNTNYSGPDTFTYTITAADGAKATATAHLDIVADPLAPASIGLRHDAQDDTGTSDTDSLTGNKQPIIEGIGQPNSTVTVTVTPAGEPTITYAAPTDSSGHWAIDTSTQAPTSGSLPPGGLPDGDVALGVSTTNGTGVTTTATGSLVVDSSPPPASIDLKHDTPNDTGSSPIDGVTNNPHPVLVGTGEPNSPVTVTVTPNGGNPVTYTATTDGNGNWSVDTNTATPTTGALPPTGLPDGPVALQVVSTDGAGNSHTATGSFTEDRTPPPASIDLKHDTPNDTGSSPIDGVTNNPHPVLVGTGEPNSPVTVTVTPNGGDPVTYTATTDGNGNWSVDTNTATPTTGALPPTGLPDGPVALQVVSTDGAGNSHTATGSFTEDRTPPPASIDLKHDTPNDTGSSPIDGVTNNPHPVLVGTGEPNSPVTVTVTPNGGDPVTYTATTDGNGNWSVDTNTATPTTGALPPTGLPDGPVALQVVSTDGAGNSHTATGSFTEDRTPPPASIDLKHDGADDTGASSLDGLTNNAKPVLTGAGEPNSTVDITVTLPGGATLTYSAATDTHGNWSLDTNVATPLTGTMPPTGIPDGLVGLQVTSTDTAGNSTLASGSFTEDHTAPVASIDLKHDVIDDTGVSSTDGLTNNVKPILTGTGEAGSTVAITVTLPGGAQLTYTAPTDIHGNWSLDTNAIAPITGTMPATGLPNGVVGLQVTSVDTAGNAVTATGSFTEAVTGPAATISLKHDATDDTGVSASDSLTNNPKPVLTGIGQPDTIAAITVTLPGGAQLTYTAPVDSHGNWSLDTNAVTPITGTMPATGIPDGLVGLQVTSTDTAGNSTIASGSFTEDQTKPIASIDLKHDGIDDTGVSSTDGLTNNGKPVLTGTGEANSTVAITVTLPGGAQLTYAAATDSHGNWSLDTNSTVPLTGTMPATGIPDGQVGLQVSTTDAAGNTATATGSFTEDQTKPIASIDLKHDGVDDTGVSSTDGLTNNGKPVLIGTGEANSTVAITVTLPGGAQLTYTAATDSHGNWSLDTNSTAPITGTMPANGIPDGVVNLQVSTTDAAGNNATATGSFTEDQTKPIAAIDLKHDGVDDTGVSSTDGLTNNGKPVLTGTGEANSTVAITVTLPGGAQLTYTAATDSHGNWSLDTSSTTPITGTMPANGIPDGVVNLQVSTTDAAGNNATATGSFTEDQTKPVASIDLKHDGVDDTGVSSTDGLTNNGKPILTGTGEANSTVAITVTLPGGAQLTYAAATDSHGNWSLDTSSTAPITGTMPANGIPDGVVNLQVSTTDAAGNSATATGSFTEDQTKPIASIDLKHDGVDDTGVSSTDGLTNNGKPVLTGTGEANSTVAITVTLPGGAQLTYTAATDSHGNWSLDTSSTTPITGTMPVNGIPDGQVGLQVSTTDAAGNNATATGSFTEDQTKPIASIDLKHDGVDDTGVSSTDGLTNNGKPVLTGTGEANSTVAITVTLPGGAQLTYAAATDSHGNWSLDTSSTTPITGTMPANGIPDGVINLQVSTTDAAGNNATATGSFTEDQTKPIAAIDLKHDGVDDTGVSSTDGLTNNGKPVLTGTGEANSTVAITVTLPGGAQLTYTTATDSHGNWSLDTSSTTPITGTMPANGIPDGVVNLQVSTTDAAGNNATATGSFTEDQTKPIASIDLKHDGVDDTGVSSTDGLTNNGKPVLTGTGEANSTVAITVTLPGGAQLTYAATTDSHGNWSLDTNSTVPITGTMPANGIPDGLVNLQVSTTDAAGNNATATGSFTEDQTKPIASIDLKHDGVDDTGVSSTDGLTNNGKPVLTGTGEANSTVAITVTLPGGAQLTYAAATDSHGNWSLDTNSTTPITGTMPANGIPDGVVNLQVSTTDAAGNNATATGSFTEDQTKPIASIDLKHDGVDDTGISPTDGITSNVHPVLTGTGEANSTVAITVTLPGGAQLTYTATTDNHGDWSLDTNAIAPTTGAMPAGGLPDGTIGLTVGTVDNAGNSASATGSFVEDHSVPAASIDLKHDGVDDTGVSQTDGITSNVHPVLTGTGEANSTVAITVTLPGGAQLTYAAATDSHGNWSLDTNSISPITGTMPVGGLPDGTIGLEVDTVNAAGNPAIAVGSFVEDHTAPVASIDLKHDAIDDTGVSSTDGLTNNGKPVLTGTGEANSTVAITVTLPGGAQLTYAAATDSQGNWSLDTNSTVPLTGTMPATGIPDGQVGLQVSTTDAAGNNATATGLFTEDQTKPIAAIDLKHDGVDDTGVSSTDGLTNNGKPVLTGTGEANSSVAITVTLPGGAQLTYAAATDSHGNWSLDTNSTVPLTGTMPATGIPDGQVGLQVSTTDAAGNNATATGLFTEDQTKPIAAIDLKHDGVDDTGVSSTDGLTNNGKPVLTGTGEANSTVAITVTLPGGAQLTYAAATDSHGNWSLDTNSTAPLTGTMPATGIPDGQVGLQVSTTDAAGNSATATGSFTEDQTKPITSIDLKHDGVDDTGVSSTDGLTNNGKPVLTGTGEANSTVAITVTLPGGAQLTYTAATDSHGNWSLDTSSTAPITGTMPANGIPDGQVGLQVSTTDAAGNNATATGSFTEDQTKPIASIDLKHDGIDDTGVSSTDGLTNNGMPVLTGTGEANSTVAITVTLPGGAQLTYTAATDSHGNWSLDTSSSAPITGTMPANGIPDGQVGLQVSTTDAAGNNATATGSFTEDQTKPIASIDLKHDGVDDTGVSSTDGLTNNGKPVLTGTGEANSTVAITVTLPGGAQLTYAAATDSHGNWSLDTNSTVPLTGTMPATGIPDGQVGLQVSTTDAAGNSATATGSFTEDQTKPIASIDLKHDGVDDTGVSSTDGLTNNGKPVLTGTGEANSTVAITVTLPGGAQLTYAATTDSHGNWSLDTNSTVPITGTMPANGIPDGVVNLQVSTTDAAGNNATATGSFIEDQTKPIASIDLKHDGVDDTGVSSTDGLTNNGKPVLTGTGEANSTVAITVTLPGGAQLTYAATTDSHGNWSLDTSSTAPITGTMPANGIPDGVVNLQVSTTDAAGNNATATGSFTEDQTKPIASIDLKHDGVDDTGLSSTDGLTNNGKPVLTGTGEANSTVAITVTLPGGAQLTYTAATDSHGNWSLDTSSTAPITGTMPANGIPDGLVNLQVSTTDAAGNNATATGSFTEDQTKPIASIDLKHDGVDDTGVSSTDGLTNNGEPVLTGTGEANSTVAITVTLPGGAQLTYAATTDSHGNWSLDTSSTAPITGTMPTNGILDGLVGLQVSTTDAAGNNATATGSFTEDQTKPIASIDLKHDGVDDTGVSSTDGLTNNGKPVLTGTGEANSTVAITVTLPGGAQLTYAAATDSHGNWSLDTSSTTPITGTMPANGIPDGVINLQVSTTDAAGNNATATGSFTEDQTKPIASIDLKHDGIDDTGVSSTDGLTNNGKPVLTGTGEANSTVAITVTLPGGAQLTYAAATDSHGNWSLDTSSTAPITGTMPANGIPDGVVNLQVSTTDAAGNNATATGSFTEDRTAPPATIDLKHDAADDTGVSASDGITSNAKPVLTGTGEANSTVAITVTLPGGAVLTYTATTDSHGAWSLDTNANLPTTGTMPAGGLPEGAIGLHVVSVDAAGNSAAGNGSFTEVLTGPVASIDLKHDAADDTGVSSTDGITNNAKPILVGTGDANSTVNITVTLPGGAQLTYTTATDKNGAWSLDTSTTTPISGSMPATGIPDGLVALKVVSTDAAGNSASATGSFTEDHTKPIAAIDLKHDAVDDTGLSSTDGITANTKPVLTGTGEANSTVNITVTLPGGALLTYSATTDKNGAWSLDTSTTAPLTGTMPATGIPDGVVGLNVVTTDVAGNSASATGSFTEDHTKPVAAIDLKHDAVDDTGVSSTDGITANTKPVLTGTGEANSTVNITVTLPGGALLTYTAATDKNGVWSLDTSTTAPLTGTMPATGIPDGVVGLNVVTTDVAGNTASATGSFTEDHTKPVAAIDLKHDAVDDTGVSSTDGITNNVKPILTGTGEANSTVNITVTLPGGALLTYTATTDKNGAWSLDTSTTAPLTGTMPATGIPDGVVGLNVVTTDVAGNSASATGSFTEDHTKPVAAIDLKHDAVDDTGVSSTDGITNNVKPILTGTGEANSTVNITVTLPGGALLTYTATTDKNGAWSLDTSTTTPLTGTMPAAGIPDGTVGLNVVTTDVAGNSASATGSFTEDHTKPVAAIDLKHDAVDDTGVSSTDGITNNVKPILTGMGEANSTVNITVTLPGGALLTYTAATDKNGAWSLDTSTTAPLTGTMPATGIPDGVVALNVVTTDVAGNSASATGSFTEDHTKPVAAIDLKHDAVDDTGVSSTDGITNNVKPILTGTGEANSTVNITVTLPGGALLTYTATTDKNGAWSLDTSTTAPLTGTMPATGIPDGVVGLNVVTTDVAGNSASATGSFTEDHTKPVAAIDLKHDAVDDTGVSSTDGITNNVKPILTGTGEANSAVNITVTLPGGALLTYTATTDKNGAWSLDTSTTAPLTGTMPAAGIPDGVVALNVVTTDVAGNSASATGSFTEDHTKPVAAIDLKHDAVDDTGVSSTDGITNNVKPILTGTGEANSTVNITVTLPGGALLTYTATTDKNGAWSLDTSTTAPLTGTMPATGIPDGVVGLNVVTTDVAGNSASATGSFTEDHTKPVAAIDLKHDAVDDTGVSSTDGITNNVKPILTGTGEANSTVNITVTLPGGALLTYTATTDKNGAWSLDTSTTAPLTGTMPATGIPDGVVGLNVVTTDVAGNSASATGSFTEDHTKPVAAIDLKHDAVDDTGVSSTDGITNNVKPILTGTGEANSTVNITVTLPGGALLTYTATTDKNGAWSLDTSTTAPLTGTMPATGIPDGVVGLNVVTTDVAGNSASATGSFTEDHTKPVAAIDLKHDAVDDTGVSSTDGITNNVKPILTGTGEANSAVNITVTLPGGALLTYTATTDKNGAWSLDTSTTAPLTGTMPAAGIPDGVVALNVVTTDVAGNSASATGSFTEDHTKPVAAIDLKHDAVDDTGVSSTDGITNNVKPILTGTGEANSTVNITVTLPGGALLTYTATTDKNGAWSLDTSTTAPLTGTMPATGIPDGVVGLNVVTTDVAGNSASATGSFTEDHTKPVAAIDLKHDAVDDTGVSSTDGITNNVKPILTGTGEANSTVNITVTLPGGALLTYTATTDKNGAWSLDTSTTAPLTGTMPATGIPDGVVGLNVVTTDVAGNSASATGSFTEDHTKPVAAIDLKHDAVDDTGVSSTDGITNNVKPILTGTGEANSTVNITVTLPGGALLTYTAATDKNGAWSLDTSTTAPLTGTMPATGIPDGLVGLNVVTTDVAGNSASATGSFTEDHTKPVAAIDLKHDAVDDTGVSSTDGITNNVKPILTGTGEANSTVNITVTLPGGALLTYTAATDKNGAWSLDTNTTAPLTGTMPAAGIPDGVVGLNVVTTDAAGNSASATGSFTEDHTKPVAAIDLKHDAVDDTGVSSTDGITNNVKPILTGTGEANSTVNITVTLPGGALLTYTAATDKNGAWSLDTSTTAPLTGTMPATGIPDGVVGLNVVTTDAAGNSASATGSFTEDHTKPVAAIDLKHDAVDDTGVSSTDGITANTKPVLTGTGEANSTVNITVTLPGGALLTYTAATDKNGAWSLDTSATSPLTGTMPAAGIPDGTVGLKVVTTDAAGNSATATNTFVEDHTATPPTISLKHDAADDTGSSATDNLTANVKPFLVGTAEALSTVTITVTPSTGAAITYTTTADATGAWTIDTSTVTPTTGTLPAAGLPDGTVGLKVVSTDLAGNVSAAATSSFTEQHVAAPTLTVTEKTYLAATNLEESSLVGTYGDTPVSSLGSGNGTTSATHAGTWFTDNALVNGVSTVEIGTGATYGIKNSDGTTDTSHVIELEQNANDVSNLYTTMTTKVGEVYNLSFDYAARSGSESTSVIYVYWEGQLVATLNTQSSTMTHYNLQLISAVAGTGKLEFIAGDSSSFGGVLDNITLGLAQDTGVAGYAVNLPALATAMVSPHGTDTLTTTIDSIPVGATLTDGTNHFTATAASTVADVTGWTLGCLTLVSPTANANLQLGVHSVVTETSTGTTSHSDAVVTLHVLDNTANIYGTSGNDTMTVTDASANASSIRWGLDGNDSITGSIGHDTLIGGAGNDTLVAGSGASILDGGQGNDSLVGGAGADTIIGGASAIVGGVMGHNTLTGGAGSDTFKWNLIDPQEVHPGDPTAVKAGDPGSEGHAFQDVITDFNNATVANGGDVLDLRDLLVGEAKGGTTGAGNLANYLHFETVGTGATASTIIHVSSHGDFASGYSAANEDTTITLTNVNLHTATNTTDAQIIATLIGAGKLIVDGQ